jgi:hypothetical protein
MPTILGKRHGHKARHKTVTEAASVVYQHLLKHNFISYPGVIKHTPGGGTVRITVTYEPSRIRIVVAGKSAQQLLLYGVVDRIKLQEVLQGCTQQPIVVRGD